MMDIVMFKNEKLNFFIKNINCVIAYLNEANNKIFSITKIIDEN